MDLTRQRKFINRLGPQNRNTLPDRLQLPQKLTILILLVFNTQLIEYIPIKIGPLTLTMLMELIVFIAVLPWFRYYARNLDSRDKYLMVVGFFMFALSLINPSGKVGDTLFKLIFTSLYAYFFIVCFFSGHPEYGIWLRRLHLIPALAAIYAIGSIFFASYGEISYEFRIGGNETSSYLAIILPICWAQFRRERGFFRFLNFIVMVVTPLVLVVTASRTAFVVFLVVTMLIMITEKATKRGIVLVTLLLILFLLVLFVLVPEQSEFRTRIPTLKDPISELEVDRVALWKAAILSIKENPFFGGDFRANVHRLILEAAPESNYARHIHYYVAGGNFGVHNGYLATAVYFGIIVAFLYFGFFFSLGKAIYHTRQRIRNMANRTFLAAGLISLIGYAVANITLHIYIGQHFFIVWAMLQSTIKNSLLEETRAY